MYALFVSHWLTSFTDRCRSRGYFNSQDAFKWPLPVTRGGRLEEIKIKVNVLTVRWNQSERPLLRWPLVEIRLEYLRSMSIMIVLFIQGWNLMYQNRLGAEQFTISPIVRKKSIFWRFCQLLLGKMHVPGYTMRIITLPILTLCLFSLIRLLRRFKKIAWVLQSTQILLQNVLHKTSLINNVNWVVPLYSVKTLHCQVIFTTTYVISLYNSCLRQFIYVTISLNSMSSIRFSATIFPLWTHCFTGHVIRTEILQFTKYYLFYDLQCSSDASKQNKDKAVWTNSHRSK